MVKPYVADVNCMKYKIDLKGKFEEKRAAFEKLGWNNINSWKKKLLLLFLL